MHALLVAERLAIRAAKSRDFRNWLSVHFAQLTNVIERKIKESGDMQGVSDNVVKFKLQKWSSFFLPEAEQGTLMDLKGGNPSEVVKRIHHRLALNIVEATDVDRDDGVTENAKIGVALAARVAAFIPYMSSNDDLIFTFDKDWLDAYIAWNINYVNHLGSLTLLAKLLAPSVLCTSSEADRHSWMHARSVTLKTMMALHVMGDAARWDDQHVLDHAPAHRDLSARLAASHMKMRVPEVCCGFGSLYELFQMLKPYPSEIEFGSNTLRPEWFHFYFVCIAWLAVLFAGLGSEMVLGETVIQFLKNKEYGFIWWHFAQLIFSLLLIISISSHDGIGLLFLPLGLWKFGFPETCSYLIGFLESPQKLAAKPIVNLINGVGTLLHHSATSMAITGIILHTWPRDRAIIAGCLVPVIQHLFVLTKYHSGIIFNILMLGLEVWFQIEVIANLNDVSAFGNLYIANIGRGLALSMLLAHYLYLLGAILDVATRLCEYEVGGQDHPTLNAMYQYAEGSELSSAAPGARARPNRLSPANAASKFRMSLHKKTGITGKISAYTTQAVNKAQSAAQSSIKRVSLQRGHTGSKNA